MISEFPAQPFWQPLYHGPGSHSCGNIKGKREKFPKRKGEKRGKKGFISTVTLSCDKKIQKILRK
jgi:hypothetical protein